MAQRNPNTPVMLLIAALIFTGVAWWLWPRGDQAPEPADPNAATPVDLRGTDGSHERETDQELARAAKASVSGTEFQMSRSPSPSKSTAYLRKWVGRNCGWPSAPAHELFIFADEMSPFSRICKAAISSRRNSSGRRPI